jgi:hypothetical protein
MTKLMQGKAKPDVFALAADLLHRKNAGYNACQVTLGKP